jgi:hypothetical protein
MRFAPILALALLSCGPSRTGYDVNAAGVVQSGDAFDPVHDSCRVIQERPGGVPRGYTFGFTDAHAPGPFLTLVVHYSQETGQMTDWLLDRSSSPAETTNTSCPAATVETIGDPRSDGWLDVRATFPAEGCPGGVPPVTGQIAVYGCPVTR